MNKLKLGSILAIIFLSFSSLAMIQIKPAQATDTTLIEHLTSLVDTSINWTYYYGAGYMGKLVTRGNFNENSDVVKDVGALDTQFIAYSFGKLTLAQLQTYIDSLGTPGSIFYYYTQAEKYGITLNQTTIEWALDHQPFLHNGIPATMNNGIPNYTYGWTFTVNYRFLIHAFNYSAHFNYETSKWNLTTAYLSFKSVIDANSGSPVYKIYDVYSPDSYNRYYDEYMQCMDIFLQFYIEGIPEALNDALAMWNTVNIARWETGNGGYYGYGGVAGDIHGYECEAGGFDELALKLFWYSNLTLSNSSRITQDINTKYLSSLWASPQWIDTVTLHLRKADLTVYSGEHRLSNTLMVWAAMFGNAANFTTEEKANFTKLLNGYTGYGYWQSSPSDNQTYGYYGPAWKMLLNESNSLYNSTLNQFSMSNDPVSLSHMATAYASSLLMLMGTTPVTANLAIPIHDTIYEDKFSIIDADLFALNLTADQLKLSVSTAGIVTFQYGSTPFNYTFSEDGVWLLTFASDWNSVETATWLSYIPTDRLTFYEAFHGDDRFEFTFTYKDLDANTVDSYISWQLFNDTTVLSYNEGAYSLLTGTYTLKTYYLDSLINSTDLDTVAYGNTTITINLQMKKHITVFTRYIAFNNTVTSITIDSETAANLTFTVLGAGNFEVIIGVPNNYTYILKDAVNLTGWVYDSVTSPDKITWNSSDLTATYQLIVSSTPASEEEISYGFDWPDWSVYLPNFSLNLYMTLMLLGALPLIVAMMYVVSLFVRGTFPPVRQLVEVVGVLAMVSFLTVALIPVITAILEGYGFP